ncbi:hypothetical protein [Caudoviricetes sp.]|nr:hypothetical protein [Caudoviricetes sp.]
MKSQEKTPVQGILPKPDGGVWSLLLCSPSSYSPAKE